jgi:hypothetical protein
MVTCKVKGQRLKGKAKRQVKSQSAKGKAAGPLTFAFCVLRFDF